MSQLRAASHWVHRSCVHRKNMSLRPRPSSRASAASQKLSAACVRRGSDAPRQSRAAECPTRSNVGLHVFPCVVTVLGGFGGQGTGHGIPTDGPKRLNKGYDLIPDSSTPDFGLREMQTCTTDTLSTLCGALKRKKPMHAAARGRHTETRPLCISEHGVLALTPLRTVPANGPRAAGLWPACCPLSPRLHQR